VTVPRRDNKKQPERIAHAGDQLGQERDFMLTID
jgi:hypothetical protein